MPGYTAERYPGRGARIVAAGHEIAHHGYLHEQPTALTPTRRPAPRPRAGGARRVAGVRPVGYRAPMWEPTWRTPRLLAERGFLYDSSLMDADCPTSWRSGVTGVDSLVEIPIQWALDDWEQYCFLPGISGSGLIESPRKARELWTLELDALREAIGCFVLTNHPFLTGRPSRAAALEQVIQHALRPRRPLDHAARARSRSTCAASGWPHGRSWHPNRPLAG